MREHLILISHDRTFLNNIVSSTIVMEGNAIIEQYNGGYDDYILQKEDKVKSKSSKSESEKAKPRKIFSKALIQRSAAIKISTWKY